jgi:integrase
MAYKSYKYFDDSIMDGMITLFVWKNSKKDIWWCRIKIPNRTGYAIGDRSLKTSNKGEAINTARDLYLKEVEKYKSGGVAGLTTWDKFYEKYLKWYRPTESVNGVSEQSKDEWINQRYFSQFFKKRKIEDLTPEDVIEYLDWRITRWKNVDTKTVGRFSNYAREPHRATVRKEVYILKRVFNMARDEGRIVWSFPDRAVTRRLKALRNNSERGRWSPYEGRRDYHDWVSFKKEIHERRILYRQRFKDSRGRNRSYHPDIIVANERLICFTNIMVNVGMRPQELLKLKFEDVELRKEKEYIDGVNIEYEYTLFHISAKVSKTDRARIAVAANGVYAWKHIEQWKSVCQEYGYGTDKRDLIFACKNDRSKPTNMAAYLAKTLKDLGLHEDSNGHKRSMYSFRHLFIDYAVKENRPIKAVRENCGTSLRMLNDYYMSNNAWDMRHYLIRRGFYERAVKSAKSKKITLKIDDE